MYQQLSRISFITTTSLALAFTAASCSGESISDGPFAGSAGALQGSAGSGTNATTGGSAPQGVGGASTSTVAGGSNNPGSSGSSNASAGTGSGMGGAPVGMGGSSNQQPCTDKQHPDHMDKECAIWPEWDLGKSPNEANCNQPWLTGAGYCLESCGKCSSGGNNGGSGNGSAGSGNGSGGSTFGNGPVLPDITSGPEYHASRYWDCCKTHCATNAGAKSCGKDGVSQGGGDSACNNGSAYACYSEAPRAVSDLVSYGYIAKPSPACGKCYHIQFTGQGHYSAADPGSQQIKGKHMIVKVSNTGSDVNHDQFDLMIPGGGVGMFQQGCRNQWGNIDFGATYGGFYSQDPGQKLVCASGTHAQRKACVKEMCNQLPAGDARAGCNWWVDWLQLADNPKFRFTEIQCPNDI